MRSLSTRRARPGASALAFLALLAGCGEVGSAPRTLPDPAPPAVTEVEGLDGPEGLCFDRDGNLYVGSQSGRIVRISRSGEQ
ncbi:MAG: hypothetical protein ACKOCT_17550 [Alphaproteobacteria bacterium]